MAAQVLCEGGCTNCVCGKKDTKSARKQLSVPARPTMYGREGTNYSVGYLAEQFTKYFGKNVPDFTFGENDAGELVINTKLQRYELPTTCNQPCKGECESC